MIALFEMKKENKTDLSNLYQIVEDCLQATKYSKTGKLRSTGAGVIKDDHQIKAHDWSRIVIGDETKLHLYLLDYEKAKGLGFIR